ncbi:FAS-associated factor 2-B-like [Hibiscus syriacus]|uniref:apyrase n=1 Tax=Hibiscus syriacus TaxID=106335 RepID=A0A6A2XRK9_HIBSY|nr:FAS-associated factor 2-B-like [Hibiscus syriacus]
MEPKSPSKVKFPAEEYNPWKGVLNVFSVGFLILLSSIGVYLAFNFVKARNVFESSYYTVVVDCGSTGTRVNVFEWGKRGLISQGLPSLLHYYPDDSTESESCHYHCMQTEPGLDKFVGNASGVRASLEPLIAWTELRVPCERHVDTSIIVLATAGLRRLVSRDAKQVLDDVEIVLREHSFVYTKNWIRVLTGKEEAYYGWVALNYKMGSLGSSSKGSTFGLLDLGGSSLQVVVEVADENDNGNVMTSDIGSTNHKILAYSLPAFGLNEAFDQTVVMLGRNQADRRYASNKLELRHPCLSSNFVQNYTCSGCTMLNITDDLENSEVQIYKNRFSSIHLVGDLNWEQCKELVKAAAMNYSDSDWSEHKVDRNCEANLSSYGGNILNLTPVAHHSGRFHALSGFFVVYDMLNLSTRASVTEIWDKGEQLCSSSSTEWNIDIQRQKYAGYYCFLVSYLASLIEDALCLGNAEIVFGPGDISWTLGAAIVHQLNANEALASISTIKNLKISSTVFLLVILLTLFLVVYCSQIKLPMLGRKISNVGVLLPSYYVHARRRSN